MIPQLKIDGKEVLTISEPLWWQLKGLQQTQSGYGSKISTQYKVKHEGRWKRVYCRIFSNSGTLYVLKKGERVIVSES